jgi:hypothetical protein
MGIFDNIPGQIKDWCSPIGSTHTLTFLVGSYSGCLDQRFVQIQRPARRTNAKG